MDRLYNMFYKGREQKLMFCAAYWELHVKNLPVPEAHVQYGFQLRDVTHGKDGPVDVLRRDGVTICVHSRRHDTYRERERIEWPGSGQGAEIVSLEDEQK